MNKIFENCIKTLFDANIVSTIIIGSGCYGTVYKIELDRMPYNVCIKTYYYPNMATVQAKEYIELKKTCLPTLTVLSNDALHRKYNILVTDYIDGENLSQTIIPPKLRQLLGSNIAKYLSALHLATNDKYGYLGKTEYATWAEFYKARLSNMWSVIRFKNFKDNSLKILNCAMCNIDKFPLKCKRPSLLHGDFNTSNILINSRSYEITAIIDPMNMCYGDSEYDLFQLDMHNGNDLKLMENYNTYNPISSDFESKNALYKAFGEYYHYSVINAEEDSHLLKAVAELEKQLILLNITI